MKKRRKKEGLLQGKVAVVTGAARGIGRAAAVAMAREGADIFGIDICKPVSKASGVKPTTRSDLNETGNLVEETGSRWLSAVLDQRNFASLKKAAAQGERAFGGIDILFANAGIQAFKPLLEMDDDDWDIQIDVNLNGTARAIRAFGPYLVKRGGGRIIVTSSTQGKQGTKYGAAYSASKWGILGLMKSAALELGEYNITVNAVIPGLIDTELTRHIERYDQVLQDAGQSSSHSMEDEKRAMEILIRRTPLGEPLIAPEDVVPVVVFLASPQARMVSGAAYEVTGGVSARYT